MIVESMEGMREGTLFFLLLGIVCCSTEDVTNVPPRLLSKPSSLKLMEGETIVLPCNADNVDGMVRVWKQLPSRIIYSGSISVSKDSKIELVDGSSLKITDLTAEYSGEYVCQFANHPDLYVHHKIQVLVPPTIILDPPSGKAIARKGSPATLVCNVNGNPKPIVSWTYHHEGGEETSSLPSGVRQVQGEQLQVASADVLHAGLYKCTADNDVRDPVSAVFNLTVLYAPELTVEPEWAHGDEDASVEFLCTSSSVPIAHMTWVRNLQEMRQDGRVRLKQHVVSPSTIESWLTIKRLLREDLGSYACVAKNSVGQSTKNVEISGLAEPVVLKGDESGENSFLLIWSVKSYSPIRQYQLKIRKYKSGDAWTDVMIPVLEEGHQNALFFSQSYNVTGLESGSKYEAVLQAHNDFGWNRPSDTLVFWTGTLLEPETIELSTEFTSLSSPEVDLEITDPTYLKQGSFSCSSQASVLLLVMAFLISRTRLV